uniref:Caspase n=1 Tax=Pithovirus LCPAC403 TaxID=2506596 RepID=A0A481ZAG0_9VIRU|nr:MAG: caspase [Pithovirus LCPAC403]
MKEIIIIGFSYKHFSLHDTIPGVYFDLFRVYSYCKEGNFDRVNVITDIKEDYTDISQIVIDNGFSSKIFDFIETIKRKGEYTMCTTSKMLIKILDRPTYENLIVYYSGHCIGSRVILPNDDRVSLSKIKEKCINIDAHQKILFILDCCNATLDLPYKLKGKTFRNNTMCDENKTNVEILCICSSSTDEESASSIEGSLFTQACFDLLREEKRNRKHISNFLSNIQKGITGNAAAYSTNLNEKLTRPKQTSRIESSHPSPYILWGWIINNLRIQIDFYPESMSILVKIDKDG